MKFEVHIDKTYFFILLGAILILAGILGVFAFNSGGPPEINGHSWEEIESPDQANRWANWNEIEGTIPEQATRWADWSEITGIPSSIADGDDEGGNQFQYISCSSSPCNLGFSPSFVIAEVYRLNCGHTMILESGDSISEFVNCGGQFEWTFAASLSGQSFTWNTYSSIPVSIIAHE
jgi:hypothetical protein